MSLFEYLFTTLGGFTFLLIGISVLGVLVYGPYLTIKVYRTKKKTVKKANIDLILILGIVVFIAGILNQIAGMIEALETMIENTNVSPKIVMGGIIESFQIPVFCAFVLIISLIFWVFNKKKWETLNA
jgi:ABC-type polysaccharide/polyol phosphate export permease